MGVEYHVQSVSFVELEEKLNLLANDGWRYVDFVFQDKGQLSGEPGYQKWGTLILSRSTEI